MKLCTTGQEKGDLLMQVTAWAGLTVFDLAKLDQLTCLWPWGVGKKCIECGFSNSEVNVTITTMYIYIYIYIFLIL